MNRTVILTSVKPDPQGGPFPTMALGMGFDAQTHEVIEFAGDIRMMRDLGEFITSPGCDDYVAVRVEDWQVLAVFPPIA